MLLLVAILGLSVLEPQVAPASTAYLGVGSAVSNLETDGLVEAALIGTAGVFLQPKAATAQFMETAKSLGLVCDPALDQCLLQLAAICTVEQAVYGLVDADRLTLRVATVSSGSVRSASARLGAPLDARRVSVQEAVADLLTPALVAALVVEAPVGSFISLDGLERGAAPLASAFNGVTPGQHFVDVRFPSGSLATKAVTLSAGRRTRIMIEPRPWGADALVWTGWAGLGVAGVSAGIASATAIAYLYGRGRLENFSTHYAIDADYNDKATREEALMAQDLLTDLPTYGYPLFVTAGVFAATAGGLLFVGTRWSSLFGPPDEETSR